MRQQTYQILALAVLAFLVVGCAKHDVAEPTENAFVLSNTMMKRIALDTVKRIPLHGVLSLTGSITADESKHIDVYPFVGGTVTNVMVELGDYVTKGQTLAIIKSGEVADYERQLIEAQSDQQLALKNLAVQKDMAASRLASDREVLAAKRELDKADAELKRIEEIYRIYSINNKSEYVVKAPISGFVLSKDINTNMTLRTDRATSIFSIAELTDVWVMANVYESDISRVTPGMPAAIKTVAYPDSTIYGTIDKVFNVLDPQTKTMTVRIRIPNSTFKIKPGMAASVELRYTMPGTGLAVPAACILFDVGKHFVVVWHDQKNIHVAEVRCGDTVDGQTFILSGLQEGDVVVSKNQLFIYDALTE